MMTFSKNWNSRKVVIASYHIPLLQKLAQETGIDSLSDAVNFLIAEYRKQQQNQPEDIAQSNNSLVIESMDDDDFGLSGELI